MDTDAKLCCKLISFSYKKIREVKSQEVNVSGYFTNMDNGYKTICQLNEHPSSSHHLKAL